MDEQSFILLDNDYLEPRPVPVRQCVNNSVERCQALDASILGSVFDLAGSKMAT